MALVEDFKKASYLVISSPGLYWAAISSYAGLLMCTFTTPAQWAKNKKKHSNIPIQENKQ